MPLINIKTSRNTPSFRKIGTVSTSNKGFGFIRTEDLEEYYVPAPLMRQLITADIVSFLPATNSKFPSSNKLEATDIHLFERKESIAIGTIEVKNGKFHLTPDEPCATPLILQGISDIPPDIVIAVTIPASDRLTNTVNVRLERILGARSQPNFEQEYALARQMFKPYFPSKVLNSAIEPDSTVMHEDLTHLPFVTIDGESSKDLDDAILISKIAEGYNLQVAIADVSYYVTEGSFIDIEARQRGTTVYFPGKVVPMLPESISNGECSLLPNKPRKAVVAQMTLNHEGEVINVGIKRALITSIAKLTYEQVTQAVEAPHTSGLNVAVRENITTLRDIYELLAAKRVTRGVMEFEDPEPKLHKTEAGEHAIEWVHRTIAHKMVEEAMLLANQSIAKIIWEKFGKGIFRHQPAPNKVDWEGLKTWCTTIGQDLPEVPSLLALNDLRMSAPIELRDEVDIQIRKVMQPAKYVSDFSTHFSLGFSEYTHFTSPIRRYSDLLVHRLLLSDTVPDTAHLIQLAEKCSNRAKAARVAERYVWDWLKKTILVKTVGPMTELDSTVVLQSRRGLRVVIKDWQCSALIPDSQLKGMGYRWDSNSEKWCNNEGVSWQLGSLLHVKIVRIDITKQICEVIVR